VGAAGDEFIPFSSSFPLFLVPAAKKWPQGDPFFSSPLLFPLRWDAEGGLLPPFSYERLIDDWDVCTLAPPVRFLFSPFLVLVRARMSGITSRWR